MKSRWLEILFNIIFWSISSYFIVSTHSIERQEIELIDGESVKNVVRNSKLISYFIIGQLIFIVYFYIEFHLIIQFKNKNNLAELTLKSIILALVTLFFYNIIARQFIFEDPILIPNISYGIFIFYMASAISYGLISIWTNNQKEKQQLEFINKEAELNLLKAQLHPHFLFNTLNNLLSMVDQGQNPRLAKSIDMLSNLLRYVVYETKKKKVLIKDEIEFLKNYSELHLLRYEEDEIDFKITINGDMESISIEPGIFLCYVENAFKHGVRPEQKSFIHINFDFSNNEIIKFSIENSLVKSNNDESVGGYGLDANLERLKLAYPSKFSLKTTSENSFNVNLTIERNENHYS